MIAELGEKIGMQVHRSKQAHGAKLDEEPGIMKMIEESGAKNVITIELPGPEIEEQIKDKSKKLKVIDHHHYTGLNRAHDEAGKMLPSSLEQFLEFAGVSDQELTDLGYDPRMIHAIGFWDSGYIWALIEAGYSREEIEAFEEYKKDIEKALGMPEVREVDLAAAEQAWENKTEWNGFYVLVSDDPKAHTRSIVSRIAAKEFWKPTPVMISERAGNRLYVQESPKSIDLFEHFGGFTFGRDKNWGYDNRDERVQLTLEDVQQFLLK
ncbi:hypothetical protein KJ910_05110 [Patescibacteria group bacterium]|nr:hypothetical protein [Patescibacteria group bacterium]MBU1906566.1 hypothetical protein [Patescibacteria group bacterium]